MSRKGFAASIARVAALVSALLAGAATEAFAAGSISGRVTSSTTGLGLGGTVVQVFDLDNDLFAGTATADSDGFYTISLPASLYAVFTYNTQGYINEIYNNIQCSAVCDVDALTPITVATNPVTDVNFVLEPGGRIAGRVTDSMGLGIPDVIVNFIDPGDNVEFTTAKTDATGNYLSDGGTATGTVYAYTQNTLGYRNEVYDNVYCDFDCEPADVGTPIAVTIGATKSGINFALDLGGRITGTVTSLGIPVPAPGIEVDIFDATTGVVVNANETDASGNYSTSGLPAGTYYASTSNRLGLVDKLYNDLPCFGGACNRTSGTPIPVTVGATASGINFSLPPGGTITGTVTNAATGAPLEDVFVGISSSNGTFVGGDNTDASGVYSVVAPTGSYFAAIFNTPGFANQLYNNRPCVNGTCGVTSGNPVNVTVGSTTFNINFALVTGGTITGTVRDAANSNAPLNNVGVQLFSGTGTLQTQAFTNPSGVFTFTAVPGGSYYVRTNVNSNLINQLHNGVTCPGCPVTTSGGTLIAVANGGTVNNIDFSLTAGGRISGRVTKVADGAGIQGNNIIQIFTAAGVQLANVATNANGNYTSFGLPPGTYFVRTQNNLGFINRLYDNGTCMMLCNVLTGNPVTVTANTTTPNINFALTLGGRITGTITNAATTFPVSNAGAQIYNSTGAGIGGAFTDTSGIFTTSGLTPGTYYALSTNIAGLVDVLYAGLPCPLGSCQSAITTLGTPIVVSLGNTAQNVNFALSPGGRLTGTVTNAATGAPIAGVFAQIYSSTGILVGSQAPTDASGNYAISGLPAGPYFARTTNSLGFANRLYNNKPCGATCTVTTGGAIGVTVNNTTPGINFALTSTFGFTDAVLQAGVTVAKTAHIIELRIDINLLRSQLGIAAFSFTDFPLLVGTPIKALHITELRSALAAVYDALGTARPIYTDPTLTIGVTQLKLVHIAQLRSAIQAVQ